MDEFTVEAIFIVLFAVLPCAIMGFLIAFKGRRNLISGYCESNFSNPEAFGRVVGASLILLALVLLLLSYFWQQQQLTPSQASLCVLSCVLAVIASYIFSAFKYRDKSD